jgi:2-hydroxy-3-keto-5-methylthiopentenyl-1-phosphate phosphatase
VYSDFESATELVAKTRVMGLYRYEESIVIGDGITDLNIATTADLVFARDRLCGYLAQKGKAFIRWEDFFDVCNHLSKRWLAAD